MSAEPPPDRLRAKPAPSADSQAAPPQTWLERAPVTIALLSLNIAVFAIQLILFGRDVLSHLPPREALAFGACYSLATVGENRWETLVTACFLHEGWIHIGFNMLALWQAGPLVERAVGSARMAPMYLVAGAAGNAASVAASVFERTARVTVGASGAICGVLAAALVIAWRVQGWGGPLTQAMVRWLGMVVAFGLFAHLAGSNVDNAAHLGGALAGASVAALWRRGYRYSARATGAILSLCGAVVAACIALVAARDQSDPFAVMGLEDRYDFARAALAEGRCLDAQRGLSAVERLRARAPVTSLRNQVHAVCGD